MALNDDYFDVLEALRRLRKDREYTIAAFVRLIKRSDELEMENIELRTKLTKLKGE